MLVIVVRYFGALLGVPGLIHVKTAARWRCSNSRYTKASIINYGLQFDLYPNERCDANHQAV